MKYRAGIDIGGTFTDLVLMGCLAPKFSTIPD
jgi:N-methylhydantoinase A/oxoprolinase/acetone carboxylase beta subunit